MKKADKIIITSLILVSFLIQPWQIKAFDPPPPPGDHNQNGDEPPGGGAPLSGGIGFLLALSAGYGAHAFRKTKNNGIDQADII